MPRETEIRLREKLAKLGGVSLLRGTKVSGEVERLQRQLERLQAETTDEGIGR